MKPSFLLTFLLAFFWLQSSIAQRMERINPGFENKANPFLQVLGLSHHDISIYRDSTRAELWKGKYLDVFMNDKKLWNIKLYNKDGERLPVGNFTDGTGRVRLVDRSRAYEANFSNGMLQDSAIWFWQCPDQFKPMTVFQFDQGLLEGECVNYSHYNCDYIASVMVYKAGIIQSSTGYGRIKLRFQLFPPWLGPRHVDPESICYIATYQDGKMVSFTCNTPKCRSCP